MQAAKLGDDESAAEVFARRLKEVREWHRLSQAGLARRLAKLGKTIDRERIARLELKRAQPTLEDVLAIAVVLDVSPLFLIAPQHGAKRGDDGKLMSGRLRIGRRAIAARDAREWIRGEQPLPLQDEAAFRAQSPEDEIPAKFRAAVKAYQPSKEQQ